MDSIDMTLLKLQELKEQNRAINNKLLEEGFNPGTYSAYCFILDTIQNCLEFQLEDLSEEEIRLMTAFNSGGQEFVKKLVKYWYEHRNYFVLCYEEVLRIVIEYFSENS